MALNVKLEINDGFEPPNWKWTTALDAKWKMWLWTLNWRCGFERRTKNEQRLWTPKGKCDGSKMRLWTPNCKMWLWTPNGICGSERQTKVTDNSDYQKCGFECRTKDKLQLWMPRWRHDSEWRMEERHDDSECWTKQGMMALKAKL